MYAPRIQLLCDKAVSSCLFDEYFCTSQGGVAGFMGASSSKPSISALLVGSRSISWMPSLSRSPKQAPRPQLLAALLALVPRGTE